ncbi:transketolase family protein [Sinanaerobacter chloroacetimidivorans]|jgi:transketolase|uniref:Transketolase family protein n=1 Tax=Sinanaerobacter chloroacetimidivorans TaxID=2818044 RepID=A0A8J7W1Y0_9FIRM|nr:transketolase family protein [Sinanaerobacter chloroacetimidivorans]MBR0598924.1 transketolase family protein [Sinanaerobacter chloroacetimidivorans]
MSEKMATRQAYGEVLLELGEKNKNIIVMDADLSKSTMTTHFAGKYPDRFFNMGISEQNLFGVAAGLAHSGKIVFASTFAMFAAGRAFEIIRNSIGYTKANVKICATHAGITVGEDGGSHQTIEDIALMRTIPGMTVISPADGASAKILIEEAAAMQGPVFVRLGRAAVPGIYEADSEVKIGKGMCVNEGSDYTVIATGIMVNEALQAATILKEEGISLRVIDMHTIKPIDADIIIQAAKETKGIVTAEEHSVVGGLGSAVSEVVAKHAPVKMAFVGLQDTFGESGKPAELMEKYGLTAKDIVAAVKGL